MIFNKKITIYFQNKNKWQIAPDLHKKSEKCDASRNYENVFFFLRKKQKRERWERGEEGKSSKEREGSKRARHDLIHALTPDHPPLAEITGKRMNTQIQKASKWT